MKKSISFIILLVLSHYGYSQTILNASSPEEFRYMKESRQTVNNQGDTISSVKEPLPYGYVNPDDIIWAQVVWEVIDLNQKLNQPYFYSSSDIIANTPYSLFEALKEGIESNEIRDIYSDEYFANKSSWDEVKKSFRVVRYQKNSYCNSLKDSDSILYNEECKLEFTLEPSDIRFIKVKGMWYIDKRNAELKYRLLGIAPMGPDLEYLSSEAYAAEAIQKLNSGAASPKAAVSSAPQSSTSTEDDLFGSSSDDDLFGSADSEDDLFGSSPDGEDSLFDNSSQEDVVDNSKNFQSNMTNAIENQQPPKAGGNSDSKELFDLFWVFYPSARKTLHNYEVLNPNNLASKVSFDDMLNARRFHSIIYKVENGLNKNVSDFFPDALEQVDFDRRFREKILLKENIMWNY